MHTLHRHCTRVVRARERFCSLAIEWNGALMVGNAKWDGIRGWVEERVLEMMGRRCGDTVESSGQLHGNLLN